MRIDTSLLPENPLDGEGLQRVKVGDRVFVWGDIQLEPPEGAELKARGLISVLPVTAVVPSAGASDPGAAAGTNAAGPAVDNSAAGSNAGQPATNSAS
jgi:hypothetical protein